MAEQREHPLNRHLFIADNLNLLRAQDNESIDLICIDPPFAKNQTFTGSLRPPLSETTGELIDLAWGYGQTLGYYTMNVVPLFYRGGD